MNPNQSTGAALDLAPFAGDWINTNEGPREIDRVTLRIDRDRMYLRVRAHQHPGGLDWGEIEAHDIYADPSNPAQAVSFRAEFKLEPIHVEVGINLNQGLLVMAMFNSWKSGTQRNYFAREFFRQ